MLHSATPTRFVSLCNSLGVDSPLATSTAQSLKAAYSNPHRHYHTLNHIDDMLEMLDDLLPGDDDTIRGERAIVELAVWFHDVVYDPVQGAPANELQSIERWEDFVRAAEPHLDGLREPVSILIRATIAHKVPDRQTLPASLSIGFGIIELFLNLDLSILAAEREAYDAYAAAIRREYAHVPDAEYRAGRMAVLGRFLERETLFYGGEEIGGGEEKESCARANVQRELTTLARAGEALTEAVNRA